MLRDPEYRNRNATARIGMALFRVTQAMKKMMQAEGDQAGYSPVQVQALLFAYHTREDVATIGNFAKTIGATHVTAVKVVNGLISKGLMVKMSSPDDKRKTLLRLSPKGHQMAQSLEKWGESLEEIVKRIPEDDQEKLEIGLGTIVSSLRLQGYLTVSEPCRGCIHFQPHSREGDEPHYCSLIQKYLSHENSLKECPEHTSSE